MHAQSGIRKIAFIGNYLPRQCGIATFTTSLCETTASIYPDIQCFSVPVTDIDEGYEYPERVRFEIKEKDLSSYERAADFLNINNIDCACLQHEFGIYGGASGGYILILLRRLKMPVITTLHTILQQPNEQQRRVMDQILALSDRVVVMTRKAAEILNNVYKIDEGKLTLIPHGILDIPFVDPNFYKDLFGVEGKVVLLTFGLLSPDKGIEYVIQALPEIIKHHPSTVYIILGATHPNLLRQEGETYRLKLQYLAEDLGVYKNVVFYNKFVSSEELKEFIGAADIYVTPYIKEEQITSGTLAYSFGAGKAVVSTPYWHAVELLSEGRGTIVPFQNSNSIAQEIIRLIENETERHAMRKNAYLMSREMVWSNVAYLYEKTFEEARLNRLKSSENSIRTRILESSSQDLPKLKLEHLFRLSDSVGVFKKAILTIPDFSGGYCTEDNAAVLILSILLEELGYGSSLISDLASKSLAFLNHAFNKETRRFRNGLTFDRTWCEETGSQECHGHALWALGTCIGRSKNEGFQEAAGQLFEIALSPSLEFDSPRAWAFTLMGIHEYFRRFDGDRLVNHGREILAGRLHDLYKTSADSRWPWFEQSFNSHDAKLSHALILSGRWLGFGEMLTAGLDSLRWFLKMNTSPKGCFRSIQQSQSAVNEIKEDFYQKPAEAHAVISACLEAFRTTHDKIWFDDAKRTFEWFLGRNDVGIPLYDSKTGGCRDALHTDRVGRNESAEASIAFYMSLVEMQSMENTIASFHEPITT